MHSGEGSHIFLEFPIFLLDKASTPTSQNGVFLTTYCSNGSYFDLAKEVDAANNH